MTPCYSLKALRCQLAPEFTAENFNGLSIDNALQDPTFVGSPEGDILTGRNSDDLLLGEGGNDTLSGVAGDDILEGGAGGDELDGGSGIDTASYEGSTNRVVINMATDSIMSGHATGDRFISIENVTGSRFGDTITGDGGGNVLSGENGQDVLSGFNGDDTLLGGAGRDLLTGGAGADALDGGVGIDMVRYVGSNEGVTVDLGPLSLARATALPMSQIGKMTSTVSISPNMALALLRTPWRIWINEAIMYASSWMVRRC